MTDANKTTWNGQPPHQKSLKKWLKIFWIGTIKSKWRKHQVSLFLFIGCLALLLGVIGFTRYYYIHASNFGLNTISDAAYNSIQLFKIVCNPAPSGILELEAARWLAFIVVIYASLRVVLDIFYEQTRYLYLELFCQDHILVCGLGYNGFSLVRQFMESDHPDTDDNEFLDRQIVVIDNEEDRVKFQKCKDLGAIVFKGDPTDPEVLTRAQIQKARYLFSIMDKDEDNAKVAVNAKNLKTNNLKKGIGGRYLECFLHISDNRLCNLLAELDKADTTWPKNFSFKYFNVYDYGAQALLAVHPVDMLLNDARTEHPHIAVIGLGKIGESLIVQAALKWRPRYMKTKIPLDILVIDEDAGLKIESLKLRYPALEKEYHFQEAFVDLGSKGSIGFKSPESTPLYISRIKGSGEIDFNDLTAIYVCLDDDTTSLYAALTLYRLLKKGTAKVVVCMSRKAGLAELLDEVRDLYAFGLVDSGCDLRAIVAGITKIIVESELPRLLYEHYVDENVKPGSAPRWDEISPEEKEKNHAEARSMVGLLSSRGYDFTFITEDADGCQNLSADEIEYMARQEHQRWYDSLTSQGWVWGKDKSQEKHTNPNLLSWDQVSPNVKNYNYDTVKKWPKFLKDCGFLIIPTGNCKPPCEPIAATMVRP